ncbi:MAG: bifunctional aspartate kinase/homoserine dehydrogenase I [Cytophagales bacterium]|nr:bifunctional aspartate kinase/homoserine dehydrogenase I [Cytophagales bacterium]
MKVLKFGGTSVGSVSAIKQVGEIIADQSKTDQLAVVVSAFSGVTNRLEELTTEAAAGKDSYLEIIAQLEAQHLDVFETLVPGGNATPIEKGVKLLKEVCHGISLLQELTTKSNAYVMSFGERMSSYIISTYFETFVSVDLYDSRDFIIVNPEVGETAVDFELSFKKIKEIKTESRVLLFPGFIASTLEGVTTTLGRGGSDYSAALLANFMNATELEIWTDVSGLLTADPNLVPQAKVIEHISYEEGMELSHFGAKVIYPPSIQPALSKDIPIRIKNTFAPEDTGTLITREWDEDKELIRGISSIKNVSLINLTGAGMVGIPEFSNRFFQALAAQKVNVILITQASSEHSICAAISESELKKALKSLKKEFAYEIQTNKISEIEVEKELAILALVGSNMRNQVGVSGQMFHVLGKNGVSVKAIAQGSSERNISAVIPQKNLKKALNVLHESFFLSSRKRIHLFIIGVGNVGKAFISQVQQQYDYLLAEHNTKVLIAGMANSRKMIFKEEGIDLENWEDALGEGEAFHATTFMDTMHTMNLRNSIFIDITANSDIAGLYNHALKNSISVVTPNKIAATSPWENYQVLLNAAARHNVHYLFETNVCAGLPVISTLGDLIRSGDKVHKIAAVLSGTLNYLFNTYDGSRQFVEIIKEAKELGLTEPDPRLDLFGEDVRRKILILARQSGYAWEMEDVKLDSFLPEACHAADTIDDFYEEVTKTESHFKTLYEEAASGSKKLRVVASFTPEGAKVGLEAVEESHPFYHLEGMDNIVLFFTNRYPKQPLVVKGAGAGADVTASGIFADILKVSLN